MSSHSAPTRREFLRQTSLFGSAMMFAPAVRAQAAKPGTYAMKGRLLKTLKLGMIKTSGSLTEKFKVAKAAGFAGVEPGTGAMNVAETKRAIADSGLPVDGTVCGSHWQIRHTSPDAATRATALKHLKDALRDTREVGGHSVLLVAGKGEDGPESEIWPRSVENISKAIPLAAELGVSILIENVWSQFLYNHEGGADQTAEKFVRYIDDFNSPWVGMQFDIGNHWKYGSMGDWIRALGGRRVLKLDVKGFSRATNKFTPIGEGDIDYPDVCKALHEINFHGWLAAEVAGGDQAYLTGVAQQMDRAFGL